ncbi:MAG TPA: ComEC/Rec2 family competence protein [Candidatus Saccharimonadales bacterium]
MFAFLLRYQFRRTVLVCAGCLALFGGMLAAEHWPPPGGWWPLLVLPAACLGMRRRSWLALLTVLLLCFGLGWWRGSVVQRQLESYNALFRRPVVLTGRATIDGVYGTRSQLTFTLDHVRLVSPRKAELPGSLSVSGFGVPAVFRGDTVQVSGKLFATRGNNQAGISFASLRVLRRHSSWIDMFRRRFAAGLQSALPEPLASFGLGLLIGQRSTLPPDVAHTLLVVGLTHIVAVSGYNLTIMVNAARRLLGRRSKYQTATSCLLLIAGFLLLTGSSPSIVRASIISTLSILAWYYGRAVPPVTLLLTAGAISALATPLYVWGNVSWYLSFLAFFGVIVVAPAITRRLYSEREPKLVGQLVLETLCAEAMTLPYVLHIFGQMSLVSLPANVLLVALVPLGMLLCAVAGLAGMLLPAAAGWLAWPARLLLTYILDMASLLSRIPHAFVEGIGFSAGALALSYVCVGWLLLVLRRRERYKSSTTQAGS